MPKRKIKRTAKKTKAKKSVIKFRPALFWDVDPRTIDPRKNAQYVISRILDFGRDNEVRWMTQYYPESLLKKTVRSRRGIHKKTKSLWSLVLK